MHVLNGTAQLRPSTPQHALVRWRALAKLPATRVSSFVQPAVAIDGDPLPRVLGNVYVCRAALEDRQQTSYSHPQLDYFRNLHMLGTSCGPEDSVRLNQG